MEIERNMGNQSINGAGAVRDLEKKFSQLLEHPHALAVCNATQGLLGAFLALGIEDAEVITTPFTWPGSLSGMLLLKNRPVFADIDPRTLTLDPGEVKEKITPKTRAILAVDIFGNPCCSDELAKIAAENGIWLIQDCAQSFGARYRDKQSGHFADLTVFSLGYGKPLFAGEGGVITTPHREIYQKLVFHTQHPQRQKRDTPHWPANPWALNMRIHPLAAEMAAGNFENALAGIAKKQAFIQSLELLLASQLRFQPLASPGYLPSFYRYTLNTAACSPLREIKAALEQKGIPVEFSACPIKTPVYNDVIFSGRYPGFAASCPVAEGQEGELRVVVGGIETVKFFV